MARMNAPILACRFMVSGRVQGVGFRAATRHRAAGLGLHGWVANRADGGVEGEVQGIDAAALDRFRDWLSRGPPTARVDRLDWTAIAVPTPLDAFTIRLR